MCFSSVFSSLQILEKQFQLQSPIFFFNIGFQHVARNVKDAESICTFASCSVAKFSEPVLSILPLQFRIFGFYFRFLAIFRRFPPRLLACFPPSFFRELAEAQKSGRILRRISRESRTCSIRSRNSETTQIREISFPLQNNNVADACKTQFRRRIEESKNPKKEKNKKKKKEKLILVVSFGDGFVVVVLASSSIIKGIDRLQRASSVGGEVQFGSSSAGFGLELQG